MRLIGHFDNELDARTFSDILYVRGVVNQVEPEDGERWEIWVHEEDHVSRATALLEQYREDPEHPDFEDAEREAAKRRQQEDEEEKKAARRMFRAADMFTDDYRGGAAPLTMTLIGISVVLFVVMYFSPRQSFPGWLFITEFGVSEGCIHWSRGLPEIRNGQVWRLITPIFMHFGILHILFNMLWLKDLGGMIERKLGWMYLGVMVLAMATASNLGQYLVSGPRFGGMSGIVYGLLGFIWMRGKFDPGSGLVLHPTTVVMMIAWFFLGLTGMVGHIANTAHAVGLGMGMAWGYWSART